MNFVLFIILFFKEISFFIKDFLETKIFETKKSIHIKSILINYKIKQFLILSGKKSSRSLQ